MVLLKVNMVEPSASNKLKSYRRKADAEEEDDETDPSMLSMIAAKRPRMSRSWDKPAPPPILAGFGTLSGSISAVAGASAKLDNANGQAPGLLPLPAMSATNIIRMRGLPFNAGAPEVAVFFSPTQLIDVRFAADIMGKRTGTCFAVFATEAEAANAQQRLDRATMGGRFIELWLTTMADLKSESRHIDRTTGSLVLLLRGLPFAATSADVGGLLARHAIEPAAPPRLLLGGDGRPAGTALVRAADSDAATRLLGLHRKIELGGRYIEVVTRCPSPPQPARRARAEPRCEARRWRGARVRPCRCARWRSRDACVRLRDACEGRSVEGPCERWMMYG